jgi:hypothetical protein
MQITALYNIELTWLGSSITNQCQNSRNQDNSLTVAIRPQQGNRSSNSGRGRFVGSAKSPAQIWCPLGVYIIFSTICSPKSVHTCSAYLLSSYRPSETEIFPLNSQNLLLLDISTWNHLLKVRLWTPNFFCTVPGDDQKSRGPCSGVASKKSGFVSGSIHRAGQFCLFV